MTTSNTPTCRFRRQELGFQENLPASFGSTASPSILEWMLPNFNHNGQLR